jgi:hypothetical protein
MTNFDASSVILSAIRRRPPLPEHSLVSLNLPLAGRPRVGHIGAAGDVAEWLKAAVC